MDMFEVRVYNTNGKLIRRSLIQAVTKDRAKSEAHNVFYHTPKAHYYTLD